MPHHSADRRGIEKVCRIDHGANKPLVGLCHDEVKIGRDLGLRNVHRTQCQTLYIESFYRGILKSKFQLVDGRIAEVSFRLQDFNEFLKWKL